MLFRRTHIETTDDAGISILKAVLPPPYIPGPYTTQTPHSTSLVPSLVALCLHRLADFPDQVRLSPPLLYRPDLPDDLLRALVPSFPVVDPRLWATLVQAYAGLPAHLRVYPIPLADIHLPLLQHIPSTDHFSLITVLELPACPELTDDTIVHLKFLHSLAALDASDTAITSHAIRSFAGTLVVDTDLDQKSFRGPWSLRILDLRNCKKINNSVYLHLAKFILLSVVDLRGTSCVPNASFSNIYRPVSIPGLYHHPTSLLVALTHLHDAFPSMHSSANVFTLHVKTLHHPVTHRPSNPIPLAPENSYAVLPKLQNHTPQPPSTITVGNSDVLARRNERAEANLRHDINKERYLRNTPGDRWHEDEFVEEALSGEEGFSGSDRYAGGDSEATEDGWTSEEEDETDLQQDDMLSNTPWSARQSSARPEFDNAITSMDTFMSSNLHKPCLKSHRGNVNAVSPPNLPFASIPIPDQSPKKPSILSAHARKDSIGMVTAGTSKGFTGSVSKKGIPASELLSHDSTAVNSSSHQNMNEHKVVRRRARSPRVDNSKNDLVHVSESLGGHKAQQRSTSDLEQADDTGRPNFHNTTRPSRAGMYTETDKIHDKQGRVGIKPLFIPDEGLQPDNPRRETPLVKRVRTIPTSPRDKTWQPPVFLSSRNLIPKPAQSVDITTSAIDPETELARQGVSGPTCSTAIEPVTYTGNKPCISDQTPQRQDPAQVTVQNRREMIAQPASVTITPASERADIQAQPHGHDVPWPWPIADDLASSFYERPLQRKQQKKGVHPHPSGDYSADVYRAQRQPTKHGRYDTQLMLFRDPPAWVERAGVGEGKPLVHRRVEEEVGVVGTREGAVAVAARLLGSVKRRRVESLPNEDARGLVQAFCGERKEKPNPFRRRQSLPASSLRREAETSVGDKPLKPISAVKIPVLSRELRLKALAREEAAGLVSVPQKRNRVHNDVNSVSPAIKPTTTAQKQRLVYQQANSGVLQVGGSRSLLISTENKVERRGIRLTDPVPCKMMKNKAKVKIQDKGYDWSAWASSSK